MIAFIDAHRGVYGVEPICRVLPIAPSTYHAHAARAREPDRAPLRQKRDTALCQEIRRVFEENFAVYGVRKVWRQLRREGISIARCTVARLMRRMGLKGVVRGKGMTTTVGDKAAPCPLDRVGRQFRAPAPNMLWLSDFTYVSTWQGFAYVAPPVALPPAASQTDRRRRLSSTRSPGGSSAGAFPVMPGQTSCSMPSSRRCMSANLSPRMGSCTTRTADLNTSAFATPSAWPKPASSPPSAASATATTMRSPRRSMASSRPK
jgi:hypothetical protein